jgi:hypothetical protein
MYSFKTSAKSGEGNKAKVASQNDVTKNQEEAVGSEESQSKPINSSEESKVEVKDEIVDDSNSEKVKT